MGFFFIILGAIVLLDIVWWSCGARILQRTRFGWLHHLFMLAQVICLAWLFLGRLSRNNADRWMPKLVVSAVFVWHMLVLPLTIAALIVAAPVALVSLGIKFFKAKKTAARPSDQSATREHGVSRRLFLGLAAAAAPPVVTFSLTGFALRQLETFRVRQISLPLASLPAALDGLTIAQVSDMHIGRFTSGAVLQRMVQAVNELAADLVLHTGDLINDELADLDHGIELVRRMRGRFGSFLIEGNHDLIENAAEFETRMKASGIPFLLDAAQVIDIRGTALQLLGLSWTRSRQDRDTAIGAAVDSLLQQRDQNAFPILLAHHPHAFDAAAKAGVPLTLSGHTHGGQLMLNEREGFGPAMFRYWSGLYQSGQSKLLVSNGVGNWFPLRVNAPAEIIHLTLKKTV